MFHELSRVAKGYASSYKLGKEVLILEDLRKRHFKLFDRRRGMDVPHATLVLKELGRLHAASLLLEKKMGCFVSDKWPVLVEKWLREDNHEVTKMFQGMIEAQMEASAMIIEKVSVRGDAGEVPDAEIASSGDPLGRHHETW